MPKPKKHRAIELRRLASQVIPSNVFLANFYYFDAITDQKHIDQYTKKLITWLLTLMPKRCVTKEYMLRGHSLSHPMFLSMLKTKSAKIALDNMPGGWIYGYRFHNKEKTIDLGPGPFFPEECNAIYKLGFSRRKHSRLPSHKATANEYNAHFLAVDLILPFSDSLSTIEDCFLLQIRKNGCESFDGKREWFYDDIGLMRAVNWMTTLAYYSLDMGILQL